MATSSQNNTCLRYKDRVTIVTGGARGIGFGIVKVFIENGSNVVFSDIREECGLQVEKEMNEIGVGKCVFVNCDMSKEEDIQRLVKTTIEKFERLDCLINNAGTHPPHATIDEFAAKDMDFLYRLNFMGYFLASKYCLPHLRKTQGNIINTGSMVALLGQHGAVTYAATKGAIDSITRSLAVDEAENRVRVNSFSPGNIDTPLWREVAKASDDPEQMLRDGKSSQLMGRFGTIEECGLVCLFLAADATFCTGININVTGGAELNYGIKTMVPVD